MASDSSSGFYFFISNQGYHRFLYGHIKYNREAGRKNKRTNTDLGQLQAQEREFCDTLHSPYICRLSRACILRETSTKATRNANPSLTVIPHCLLLLTVLPLDCYLMSTGLFLLSVVDCPLSVFLCQFLSSLGPSVPRPLQVSQKISSFGPLCGFRAKADKKILWTACTHTTQHNELALIVSHFYGSNQIIMFYYI